MNEHTLALASKYMQIGPSRASLLHIGYMICQGDGSKLVKHTRDELGIASPLIEKVGKVRLSEPVCVPPFLTHMCGPGQRVRCVGSGAVCRSVSRRARVPRRDDEEARGNRPDRRLAVRGNRLPAHRERRSLQEESVRAAKRNPEQGQGPRAQFIEQCTKEAFTVHCLFGLLPVLGSALVSTKRNLERGERVLAMLALLSAYSKFAQIMILVQVAFVVRMAQVLSMFEIRRCEADIRTISPSLIHRITARFKSLLHECHMIGNTSHGVLVFYVSVVINVVQMITGVYAANFGAVSEEFEGSEDERPEEIAPAWVFFAVFVSGASAKERVLESEARSLVAPPPLFIRYDEHTLTLAWQQPMITLMIYLKSYGDLNLAIERDVDQVRNEREMRGRERMITPPPPFFTKCVGR